MFRSSGGWADPNRLPVLSLRSVLAKFAWAAGRVAKGSWRVIDEISEAATVYEAAGTEDAKRQSMEAVGNICCVSMQNATEGAG